MRILHNLFLRVCIWLAVVSGMVIFLYLISTSTVSKLGKYLLSLISVHGHTNQEEITSKEQKAFLIRLHLPLVLKLPQSTEKVRNTERITFVPG